MLHETIRFWAVSMNVDILLSVTRNLHLKKPWLIRIVGFTKTNEKQIGMEG